MKRIAALSLVAAMAASSVAADTASTKPTVSSQMGLGLSAIGPGAIVAGIVAVAVVATVVDSSSGT